MEKQLEKIRREIILKGKRNPKFQEAFKTHQKANDEKYTDLDDIDNSGAINLVDAQVLYHMISTRKIKTGFDYLKSIGKFNEMVVMCGADIPAVTVESIDYFLKEAIDSLCLVTSLYIIPRL